MRSEALIMERHLRRGEVARILGVAKLTLYRWVRQGKINVRSPGGAYGESEIYRILSIQKPRNRHLYLKMNGERKKIRGVWDSRNPSDCSVLTNSDKRRICGLLSLTQICASQTSHTRKTLNGKPTVGKVLSYEG